MKPPKCKRCDLDCQEYSPGNFSSRCKQHTEEDSAKQRARMQRLRERRIKAGLPANRSHTCHLPTALRKEHPVNRAIHTLAKHFGFKPSDFTNFLKENAHKLP